MEAVYDRTRRYESVLGYKELSCSRPITEPTQWQARGFTKDWQANNEDQVKGPRMSTSGRYHGILADFQTGSSPDAGFIT